MQQQGRQQDVETSRASFQQSLSNTKAGAQAQLSQQEAQRKETLKMKMLELAIQNGINLADLGITL
jgi:F0F1-type ATP synthase membrane subunit b/b'